LSRRSSRWPSSWMARSVRSRVRFFGIACDYPAPSRRDIGIAVNRPACFPRSWSVIVLLSHRPTVPARTVRAQNRRHNYFRWSSPSGLVAPHGQLGWPGAF
jgi:hypothetical protein